MEVRNAIVLALVLSSACAFKAPPRYDPQDPLAGTPRRAITYRIEDSTQTPVFSAVVAEGYASNAGRLDPAILAIYEKKVTGGEAGIVVERYSEPDGNAVDRGAFLRNLSPDVPATLGTHTIAGRRFPVAHGVDFISFRQRITAEDPYSDYLGTALPPPRLSILEGRRFPPGGQAYRFYRCRKLGAWGLLADYRRSLRRDEHAEFLREFSSTDRKIASACFGQEVLMAMQGGREATVIPKPSMYRLRIMARDEWVYGASRAIERECVHLRDFAGGFYALRLRAPLDAFNREHLAFESFISTFCPLPANSPCPGP